MNAWLIAGIAVAIFLAWNNGSNNAANMIGTAVGAGVISLRRALALSSIATLVGALLLGKYVTNTVMRGIVNIASLTSPVIVSAVMISVLASASLWTLISSFIRVPMSVHACVLGGLIGAGLAIGMHSVNWSTLARIFISWLFVPFIAAGFSCALLTVVNRASSTRRGLRVLIPLASFVMIFVPMLLSFLKSRTTALTALGIAIGCGLGASAITMVLWLRTEKRSRFQDPSSLRDEAMKILLIEAAIAMSFSFGSNDVANSAGPLAAILYVSAFHSHSVETSILTAVTVAGCSLAMGIATWGSSVVETVGRRITLLSPSSAFVAQLSAAIIMAILSRLGIPASTSMAIVGGVMGVGMARGLRNVDFKTVAKVFGMWYIAIPCAAATAYIIYILVSRLFLA